MILLLQVAVVLAAARGARWLIRPLGQPAVVGEMIAGLLLGPSGFGWLMPTASAALFAPESLAALNALSQLGLVLFMFLVGIRLGSPRASTATRRVAIVTSATSIVVPFTLGAWLASILHARLAPPAVAVLPFSLFVGAAMSITAFPVLARILVDRDLLTTEIGVTAIACAAFDDVAGWMILGGVMTLVHAGDGRTLAVRALAFVGYLAVMMWAVQPALRWFAARRGAAFGSPDDLVLVMLVMLLSAVTTDVLGVHALFGAFFAGLMMPKAPAIERAFVDRVEPLTIAVLLPLFFAFTGLRTQVGLLDNASLWGDAGAVLLVAVVGKGGASIVASRAMGLTWRDAGALGALLNTRGLIELVVLNIGLELGVLSPIIFSMLVLMAIVTTCMTSPLIAWLQRR